MGLATIELLKYYANLGNFIRALRKPGTAFRFLKRAVVDVQDISKALNIQSNVLNGYIGEIRMKKEFKNLWQQLAKFESARGFSTGAIDRDLGVILYALVRVLKPTVVLETGVSAGTSSAYILCALEENRDGRLFSIDLPMDEYKLEQPGWIVPDELRHRWRLILSRSSEALPALLQEVGTVDMFFHDSDHSYENMLWEYRSIWPHLRHGGLLLSHNINLNNAFSQFSSEVEGNEFVYGQMIGGIVST